MIRVELIKLLRRPRTWVTIAALNAAAKVSSCGSRVPTGVTSMPICHA